MSKSNLQIVIINTQGSQLRGYAALLVDKKENRSLVHLLDGSPSLDPTEYDNEDLISTGTYAADLVAHYAPSDTELATSIEKERQFPVFIQKKRGSKKATKKSKPLTEEQKVLLAKMIKQKLAETEAE